MSALRVVRLNDVHLEEDLATWARATQYVRGRSLEQDPHAFSPANHQELSKPPSYWITELRREDVQFFFALSSPVEQHAAYPGQDIVRYAVVRKLSAGAADVPCYFLAALWVDPAVRHQKIGSGMVRESRNWIKADALAAGSLIAEYRTAVMKSNEKVLGFYRALDFMVDSDLDQYKHFLHQQVIVDRILIE